MEKFLLRSYLRSANPRNAYRNLVSNTVIPKPSQSMSYKIWK